MDIGGQEVVYFYNPGVNAVRNCPVAVTLAMANYRTFNVEAVIFVDDLFMRLSEETKKFVIAHEYGHAISGHFRKLVKMRLTGVRNTILITRSLSIPIQQKIR